MIKFEYPFLFVGTQRWVCILVAHELVMLGRLEANFVSFTCHGVGGSSSAASAASSIWMVNPFSGCHATVLFIAAWSIMLSSCLGS